MTYETICFSLESGIARLTLNRPDKLNSITLTMHAELRDALSRVEFDSARVLVLTGAGRAFCTGQDLSERIPEPGRPKTDLGLSIERNYAPLVSTLRELDVPVIAAVNGVAAGAGCNLALACDMVVAARSASFIQSFCKLGLLPDCGGTWTLPRAVGIPRALGLTLLGETISAEQAERWGMIWKCVDDEIFPALVDELATRLSCSPTRGLAATKRAIYAGTQSTFTEALDRERDGQRELGFSSDYSVGLDAFKNKRTPVFTGR